MKRKTAELSGLPLRWAVALVTQSEMPSPAQFKFWGSFNPDINWIQGGPLFDKHATSLRYDDSPGLGLDDFWEIEAYVGYADDVRHGIGVAKTKLKAFCIALVAAKFGDELEIPDELCEAKP